MLSKDPLQDAVDAAYFKYSLTPDHTSVEAWIHDTIFAQFPDSPPSIKTRPLSGCDTYGLTMNYGSRSRQDKPNMVYSDWTPQGGTPEEFSPFDPAGGLPAPTLDTPVCARGQQIAFAGAGQPMSWEESVFDQPTQRQLFLSQCPANSSPQKKLQASQKEVYAKIKGVPPSLAGKSQSSLGINPQSPGGRSKASSGKTFTQTFTLDEIDMDYLAACDPSINLYSQDHVMKNKIKRPDMARDFMRSWNKIPGLFIPNQLKVSNS